MVTYLYKFMEMSTEFSESIPYVFIAIGASISIVSTMACVCTAKGQPALLYLYGGYLALIFVLLFGTGVSIFAYRTKLLAGFDKGLNESMHLYRPGNDELIADFDEMQETLKCCGNHRYSDWLDLSPSMPTPISCCIVPDCETSDPTQIYTEGCYDKVVNYIRDNVGALAIVVLVLAFMPLLGVFFACCLARSANKARYQQMA